MGYTRSYLESLAGDGPVEVLPLVDHLLRDAIQVQASDIHIEPWEFDVMVRLRLNGVLTELVRLPLDLMEKISGRIKVMANLVSYQTGLPQDGHAGTSPEMGGVQLRISTFPTTRGEKIVIRLFDPRNRSFDLEKLGFELDTLQRFLHLLSRPSGLILLTGPTGSGKTTAIYAALCHLIHKAGSTISVSTVEDPVEFNLPMVSQAQINPAQNFTYPVALKSLLRQDPQVLMIGEIRDPETASIAVQAGLTGHLVISTIHSGSTAGVFARLMHMNLEPFLLASSISGVLGLRLVRTNCLDCAQPYPPEPWLLRQLPKEVADTANFRQSAGCPACVYTGFAGRASITELLLTNEAVRDVVIQKSPTRTIENVAVEHGMKTIWQHGLRRVLDGQTPLSEILRVVSAEQF